MELTNLAELRPLLEKYDFRFSKSLGQNFLTAQWVPERIISESGIDSTCGVLEIGPGVGVLTNSLSKKAAVIAAIELDNKLIPLLSETLAHCGNVSVIHGNILTTDLPFIVDKYFSGLRPVVCANIPYSITTPVLTKLLCSRLFSDLTVMVQREVAARICAQPASADYGSFSVFSQYYSYPRILFDVPPDCFFPRPKVTSTVINMHCRTKPEEIGDEEFFFKVVRAAFSQRRKTLINALLPLLGSRLTKADIAAALTELSIDEKARGETLGIKEFAAVAKALHQ